jgi:arsenite-transporting ATPase
VPLDYGMQELETLFDKLESIQKVFLNPDICSIRIVCNPERMVVQEAKRAYTYLQLYGYNVDAVIVNRVLPEAASEGAFFQGYLLSQKTHLAEIEESFQPLPILKMYHLGKEVFGVKLLEHIAETLYKDTNPAEVFYNESPIKVVEDKKYYQVQIRLPFVDADDIELSKYGDELLIEVENRRKSVFLPRFTNFLEMKDYWFEAPILTVRLHKK